MNQKTRPQQPAKPVFFPRGAGQHAVDRMYPRSSKWRDRPELWAKDILDDFLWSKQIEIMHSVRDHKQTAVKSCHSAGKSFITSRIMGWWLDPRVHALGSAFALSTAPSWPQIEAILWRYLKRVHAKGKLPGRITGDCQWHMAARGAKYKIGDPTEELIAMGRKPADYDEDSLQGIHARYVLGVIDEANGVERTLWDSILAITTNDDSRVLAIGNPENPESYFAEVCKPNSGWNVIEIPAWCVPTMTAEICRSFERVRPIPEEEIPEDLAAELLSPNWVHARALDWGVGSPNWQGKIEAEFPEVTDDTLISPRMIDKGKMTVQSGLEMGQYGVDIARYGEDKSMMYRNRGFQIRLHKWWAKMDTAESTDKIEDELARHGVNAQLIPVNIDAIGVGSGPFDNLRRKGYNVRAIYGSEKARNPKRYRNRRAEIYWTFRALLDECIIDLDPEDELLHNQLMSIKWWENDIGQIVIEGKEDMRKRGLPSPDRADAAVLSLVKRGSTRDAETHAAQRRRRPGESRSITGDLLLKNM